MTVYQFTSQLAATIALLIVASAAAFAVMGFDDLILDVAFWLHRWYRWMVARRYAPLSIDQLRAKPEQRIAIFIPCWHEHDIVDKMIELASRSLQYQKYDLFIGVYPNDPLTRDKALAMAKKFPRVKVVINSRDGPTTKAQNLNEMWNQLVKTEGRDPYDIVVLHDVEDVIHPLSLMLYNFLIPRRDMVQLPVFPLERQWNQWTTWTYADEFAENHLKDLVAREAFGSFVPCAGVGCAFRREALENTGKGDLFPTDSLTEDYQLGLHFRERGLSTIIVHQRLGFGRGEKATTAAAYVATREFFPDTFSTAIRQKARWIIGICFQAWQQTGWTGNFFTRYTLYRDRKAILANLLVLAGYAVLAATLGLFIWGRFDSDVVQPHVPFYWWPLLYGVFAMTLLRIIQKGYFVYTIYGPLQGFLATIRIPWAGIINAFATARACWLFARSVIFRTKLVWSKTSHAFPTGAALSEYRRQLGDVLVEQELVTNDDVAYALAERKEGERIGETLVRLGYLTQRQLAGAVAKQLGAEDGSQDDLVASKEALAYLTFDEARKHRVLPLRPDGERVLVAVDDEPSNELDLLLKEKLPAPYTMLMVEPQRLVHAIERSYTFGDERRKPLGAYLLDKGWLTRDQLEMALIEQDRTRKGLFELIVERGYVSGEPVRTVLKEYFGLAYVEPPASARVPAEHVVKIPARILRDSVIVPYVVDDTIVVASQYPIDRKAKEVIEAAIPGNPQFVASSSDALSRLRKEVFRIIEHRKQLGEMLVEDRVLTNEELASALERRAPGEKIGETLVRLGILTDEAITATLSRQAKDTAASNGKPPIGVYLLEKGYLTRQQIDDLLMRQDEVKIPLFAMIVEAHLLDPGRVAETLEEYFELPRAYPAADYGIPIEHLKLIPTKQLQDHLLAVYESGDAVTIAAPYPLSENMKKRVAGGIPGEVSYIVCSEADLMPIRTKMLREIDVYEIYTAAS